MAFRITTWNVNGIRNPFQYQPWRDKRQFETMFEILEADIVIFQETKIQRKDLRDDMVLVPGWDCYWSLPKHKKGYSGVVIYTRQSVCAPIRAEEGLTGILCAPNSSTSFSELPEAQQIGGYPSLAQLASSTIDAATIDSEGRCVILEFPAFVLLGVYSPANRDESRDDFRLGFLNLLDARIRNLISMGKRVFLAGDMNISREEIDTANAEASMRKNGVSVEEYISTPSRRLFNQLLEGGKVLGEREEGREEPAMWDICRCFHPGRKGMFTCWEQKTNARPGNCGSRIDYVLCSLAMKDWFSASDIQEGLMGSDHCPVYATIKKRILMDGRDVDLLDVMNPAGMFLNGNRLREYSTKDILSLSGKLIPEFDGRRSIRDMFSRKSSLLRPQSANKSFTETELGASQLHSEVPCSIGQPLISSPTIASNESSTYENTPDSLSSTDKKRPLEETLTTKAMKRAKSNSTATKPLTNSNSQRSLKVFFKPKAVPDSGTDVVKPVKEKDLSQSSWDTPAITEQFHKPGMKISKTKTITPRQYTPRTPEEEPKKFISSVEPSPPSLRRETSWYQNSVHDPVESKDSWSKLFTKPAAPRCESHNEPCISLMTKKSGMNCGRSFWMCARPLGPTGTKERNTQWRCQTFIWCSDWTSIAARDSVQEGTWLGSAPSA